MAGWVRGCRIAAAVAAGMALLVVTTRAAASWTTASWTTTEVVVAQGEVLWDPGGEPLSVEEFNQERPRLVSDGASGAIVTWLDERLGVPYPQIYAQRVLSDGTAAWATNGVSLSEPGSVSYPLLATDGAGGALVVWMDWRAGDRDVYAQRVLSDGTAAWATGDVAVCAASGDQVVHGIAPDGAGGAIVVWDDYRDGDADVYVQRVLSDGTAAWTTDGIALTALAVDQWWASITTDGAGGGIVVWHGGCGGVASICAQRVGPDGTPAWVAGGVPLGGGGWPVMDSDGAGGALVVWQDMRAGEYNIDLYAQRVLSDGTVAWATDGVALTQAGGYQWFAAIASDGAEGALVAWQDERVSASDSLIYAQRVLSDGTVAWATDGVRVSTEGRAELAPDILADGAGGAWVVWRSINIYAQRLRPDGTARWTGTLLVCDVNEGAGQHHPRLVSDGAGGALVAWEDNRRWYHGNNYDIYAQRVREVSYRTYFPVFLQD